MPRSKFAEIDVPVTIPIPKHVVGMLVVSDYTSDGKRHLFLRRPEPQASPAVKSPAKPAKKKPTAKKVTSASSAPSPTSPATSFNPPFPGGTVEST